MFFFFKGFFILVPVILTVTHGYKCLRVDKISWLLCLITYSRRVELRGRCLISILFSSLFVSTGQCLCVWHIILFEDSMIWYYVLLILFGGTDSWWFKDSWFLAWTSCIGPIQFFFFIYFSNSKANSYYATIIRPHPSKPWLPLSTFLIQTLTMKVILVRCFLLEIRCILVLPVYHFFFKYML